MIKISFGDYVKKGFEIAKLNEKAIDVVSKDKDATNMAVLFYAIGGAAAGIMSFNAITMVSGAVAAALFSFLGVGILHLLAKLFGGKGDFMSLYKPLGIGSVLSWFSAIPVIGWVINLWVIVVQVVTLRAVHKLTTGKAVIVVLIPVIIAIVVAFILAATFVSLFAGSLTAADLTGLEAFTGNFLR